MTSKPVFEIKNTTYKLSIQLSLNGFSFCIANSNGQVITFETNYLQGSLVSEQELKQQLSNAFENKPELQAQFAEVHVVYTNELYCFVPKEFYNASNKPLYFKYTLQTLATDYISEDILTTAPIVNLFIPYVNINNYLLERFKEFNFQHSSGLLVNYLLQKGSLETQPKVHLYFHAKQFDLVITKGKQLLLCNTYANQSNEDVVYYVLFAMEQLELSVDSIQVTLLNPVTEALYSFLYKYVRNVEKSSADSDQLIHRLALNV